MRLSCHQQRCLNGFFAEACSGNRPIFRIQKDETIAFPVQLLDTIPVSTAEQKQCIGKRIQLKRFLHHGSQTIYSMAQICVAAGNLYLISSSEIAQHDFSSRSTIPTVSASAPPWMRLPLRQFGRQQPHVQKAAPYGCDLCKTGLLLNSGHFKQLFLPFVEGVLADIVLPAPDFYSLSTIPAG